MDLASVYTVAALESRFEKVRWIGSGGEGVVYEVNDRSSGNRKALKISSNNWKISLHNRQVAEIVLLILKRGLSPHLTQIHELLAVNCRAFARLAANSEGSFFDAQGESYTICSRRAYLMEILNGDLEALYRPPRILAQEIEIAIEVQIVSIRIILGQQNVKDDEAGKWRNILYKRLGPEDLFQEKPLIDFDFWKYTFGKYQFYLPRHEYLIKLADYDGWMISDKPLLIDPKKILKNHLAQDYITLKQCADLFKQPEDANAKILEIYNSNSKLFACKRQI